ncbi:MAG: ABC transporter substrate-binding protein [Caldilineales bacterium]|nr:ABC transporter substrate-binding protein [Caldilineales bacterium]
MKKTNLLIVLSLLALLLAVAACVAPAAPAAPAAAPAAEQPAAEEPVAEEPAAEELVPLDFRLNWTLYGEHAPFFLGVEKGFYEDEGLDVNILEGSGSGTVVKLIGNGTNVIGYADSATMMRGVSAGVPVKAVAVTFQSSPMSFIYREDAARPTTIEELPGTKVAITAGDASLSIFEACLGANGLTMDDVELIQVSNPQAKEVAVLEGTSDTFLGYFVDQPMRMEKVTGVDIGWKQLTELCGVNTLSSAIIANNFWAEQNPDLVEKFVRASQRAWQYTLEHPEEAAEIFAATSAGDMGFDVPLSLAEIEGSLTLLHTPNSEGKPIGWSSMDDWVSTQQTLEQYASFKPEEDVNVFFTNDFISEPPYEPPQ